MREITEEQHLVIEELRFQIKSAEDRESTATHRDPYISFLKGVLFKHTKYICEPGCTTCGLGKMLTLNELRRLLKVVHYWTPNEWEHLLHGIVKEPCLVCLVDDRIRGIVELYSYTGKNEI